MTAPYDLPSLKALDAAATPGPWKAFPNDKTPFAEVFTKAPNYQPSAICLSVIRAEDAALIAAARTALPGLVERVETAEPFFRLASAVINPVNGDRPWHADSADWTVVFSFAGESITLGDLRKAAALKGDQA